jgi:hypothetical protein
MNFNSQTGLVPANRVPCRRHSLGQRVGDTIHIEFGDLSKTTGVLVVKDCSINQTPNYQVGIQHPIVPHQRTNAH